MYYISHRGNLKGKKELWENHPSYISEALLEGYDVELDVWSYDGNYYLGHDEAQFKIDLDFLLQNKNKFWCHAKNYDALTAMLKEDLNCFWHQEDTYTITSKGIIWQYPSREIYKDAIFLMPEKFGYKKADLTDVKGICSDYIKKYK